MNLQCPHCGAACDGATDLMLSEIACPNCGKLFRRAGDVVVATEPRLAPDTPPDKLVSDDTGGMKVANSPPSQLIAASGAIIAGRYRLLQHIAEGGMGTVWMAEQRAPMKKRVALKLVKPGLASKDMLARFEAERQALALMDHPNIAQALDGGTTDDGQPFFVMEYVKGIPLTQYCDARKLSVPARLELFIQICQAVQHAHQKAIIHRDLKPSNILVAEHDDKPLPKVIDFGLAKALQGAHVLTDRTMFTALGSMVGTPPYMAPEQFGVNALDVDTRTDVYALGAILYELLTGSTPIAARHFREKSWDEICRIIRTEESQRPSQRLSTIDTIADTAKTRSTTPDRLVRQVRGDLDWIVLKALEKDRSHRFASADLLANELRRHLDGEPIQTRPISRRERVWRWCKRNPAVAALSSALLLMLVGIVLVAPLIAWHQTRLGQEAVRSETAARAAEKKAIAEAQRAEREAQRADEQAKIARDEAAASKRLANFIEAQFKLSQGRLSEAYHMISAAMAGKPSWEYGRVFGSIVEQARRDWQLLARKQCREAPGWGCFVGRGPKWLVVSQGNTVEVFSPLSDSPVSSREIPDGGRLPCAVGADRLAVATASDTVTLFSMPEVKPIAVCGMQAKILDLRAALEGEYFVVLDDSGLVRVFDRAGAKCAEKAFSGRANAADHSRWYVDMSPSGQTVMFDTGIAAAPKSCWRWKTDELLEIGFNTHHARFQSDQLLVGYHANSAVAETATIHQFDLAEQKDKIFFSNDNFLSRAGAKVEGAGTKKEVAGLALVVDDAIHLFDARAPASERDAPSEQATSNLRMHVTRFHSLWPQNSTPPKLLALDPFTRTLALTVDREIMIFGRWPLRQAYAAAATVDASCWSAAVVGNRAFTVSGSTLHQLNLDALADLNDKPLDKPADQADPKREFMAWGLAVTPDANRIAVLWQESSGGSGQSADYFRKIVRVYEPSSAAGEEDAWRVAGEVELTDFEGLPGLANRSITITPDGQTVAFQASDGRCTGYYVHDRSKRYEIVSSRTSTFARCADPPLLGIGNYGAIADYKIWDLQTGQLRGQISLDSPVRRAAFSADGKQIYIGTTSNELRCYDVQSGAFASKVATSIAPVSMPRDGEQFLGFLPDTTTAGSLVLADLPTGRTLENLDSSFHIVSSAFFSQDGTTIVNCKQRLAIEIKRSVDAAVAAKQLEQTSIQAEWAAASEDLSDYLWRSAGAYARRGRELRSQRNYSAARSDWQQVVGICSKLAGDFPGEIKYRAKLGDGHHQLGHVFDDLKLFEQAREQYQKAIDIESEVTAEKPDDVEFQLALASSHWCVGKSLSTSTEDAQATKHIEQALEIYEKLHAESPKVARFRSTLAERYSLAGAHLTKQDQKGAAWKYLSSALELYTQLAADFPSVTEYRDGLVSTHRRYGDLLGLNGDADGARSQRKQADAAFDWNAEDVERTPFEVKFFHWEAAGPQVPPPNWEQTIAGDSVDEQSVQVIDYSPGGGSPTAKCQGDFFGIVAKTKRELPAGKYRIEAVADDGVRVWIDDNLVIDQWRWNHEARHQAEIELGAGVHAIRIEYFEVDGIAKLQFGLHPLPPKRS